MKYSLSSRIAVFLSLLSCHPFSYAAAYQFYEVGAPIIGTAGVGQAALGDDASVSYFNPAGMSQLKASAIMIGSQFMLPYTNFSPNNSTTITGDNGGTASSLAPGLGLYYAYRATPGLSLGVSVNSPYGGMLSYNNHWVGRYNVQQMTLYTVDFNPSAAYQFNQYFGMGAGLVFEYANLTQSVALPLSPVVDGVANIKVNNLATGFNLGMLITPTTATKIGLAYRTQIVHHMTGDTNFLNITTTPATHTKLVMPANLILSLAQDIKQFTLLAELGWANWSSMRNTVVTVDGFSAVTPTNWSNTYRVGLGGQYHYSNYTTWQLGASYDTSPTSSSKRLPDLPMDGQIRAGAGLIYALAASAELGASYEYINLGSADINNTSAYGVLSGKYKRNYANVLQLSLNVYC
jgi:long-chain fatty acid transport protein